MQVKNNFIGSKMNKDVDERLIENGTMVNAENIRVFSTEGSDSGVIETVLGNSRLTNLGLTNAFTIGSIGDWANQLIYALITSDEKDIVIEYDIANKVTSVLVEGLREEGKTWINFNKHYLVTSMVKVVNDNLNKDLLLFTDGLNNIRCFNISRAKRGLITQEKDWKLIKTPPRYPIRTEMTFSDTAIENNLNNKFLSFMYRFVLEDGEYTAFSGFTNYKFSPSKFDIDFETMENKGMVNQFNAINLFFNTGDYLVKDIEIAFKESGSNAIYLIERFNKKDQGWADDTEQYFKFTNNKIYAQLDPFQLTRSYDAIPRTAKTIGFAQNRLVIANYLEGYNMLDSDNQKVVIDYGLRLKSSDIGSEVLKLSLTTRTLDVKITSDKLKYDSKLGFDFHLTEDSSNPKAARSEFYTEYILNKTYNTVNELVFSDDFQHYLNTIVNTYIVDNLKEEGTFPKSYSISEVKPFKIVQANGQGFILESPELVLKYYSDPNNPSSQILYKTIPMLYSTKNTTVTYNNNSVNASVKSYRSYEVGILYMDEDGRTTPTMTCANNTVFVPLDRSSKLNKIQALINHKPPYFADRYKFVIKQSKGDYETLYVNRFYQDGVYRWIALEGANKDKVNEGDILIVKSDLGGVLENPVKVRILEVSKQEQNFISGRDNKDLKELREVAGLYMKVKPSGFDMNYREGTSRTYEGTTHLRYPIPTYSEPAFGQEVDGVYKPFVIGAGSTVRIYLQFKAQGNIKFNAEYDKKWVIANYYASFKEFFENEVVNLGGFGTKHTNSVKFDPSIPNHKQIYKDGGTYGIGYGFNEGGKNFFIYSGRYGTQSRSITSYVKIEIYHSDGTLIFETESEDINSDIFYETEEVYDISNGLHEGNIENQTNKSPAVVDISFYNCFTQGNGAESYKYLDAFNTNKLHIDLRPTAVIIEPFSEIHRSADITYSEPYVENNGINGLNEFNLSRSNYKDDIVKSFGEITHVMEDNTDLMVFQEDKVSRVLVGKNMITASNGENALTTTENVLGQQIPFAGTYGTSHPESIAQDANSKYYVDVKRGAVVRLGGDGNEEISDRGMHAWFRDFLPPLMNSPIFGAFDPYYNEYVIALPDGLITRRLEIGCENIESVKDFDGTLFVNYKLTNVNGQFKIECKGDKVSEYILYDSLNNEINRQTVKEYSYDFHKMVNITNELILVVKTLEPTNYTVYMTCPVKYKKHYVTTVFNDSDNTGLSTSVRWRSFGSYTTPYKDYPITLTKDTVLHEEVVGDESNILIPPEMSYLRAEILNTPDIITWKPEFKIVKFSTLNRLTVEEIKQRVATMNSLPVNSSSALHYAESPTVYTDAEEYIYIVYVLNQAYPEMIAVNDEVNCDYLTAMSIDVLSNDTYSGNVSIEITMPPSYGKTTVVDGKVVYINETITTTDSFRYKIKQGDRYSNEATCRIIISPFKTKDDNYEIKEGQPSSFVMDFLGNDMFNENPPFVVEIIKPFTDGTLTEQNGVYTYTLKPTYEGKEGIDTCEYRLTINDQHTNTSTVTVTYDTVKLVAVDDYFELDKVQEEGGTEVLPNDEYDRTKPITVVLNETVSPRGEWYLYNNSVRYSILNPDVVDYEETTTYYITDGKHRSNNATVTVKVKIPAPSQIECKDGLTASGDVGVYKLTMNMGTKGGDAGISFDTYGVPDKFIIKDDQDVTLAESKYRGNNAPLAGNKIMKVYEYDNELKKFLDTGETIAINVNPNDYESGTTGTLTYKKPITEKSQVVTIYVYGTEGGTTWALTGLCPTGIIDP